MESTRDVQGIASPQWRCRNAPTRAATKRRSPPTQAALTSDLPLRHGRPTIATPRLPRWAAIRARLRWANQVACDTLCFIQVIRDLTRCASAQHKEIQHGGKANDHDEGIVVESAGLHTAHDAGEPTNRLRRAIHQHAVD